MRRIRPHLGLTLSILAGATIGTGSSLAWRYVLAPDLDWWWALLLIAGGTEPCCSCPRPPTYGAASSAVGSPTEGTPAPNHGRPPDDP